MRDLFGAEVNVSYDVSKLLVVDASPRPGVQVAPGSSWGVDGEFFVAENAVDNESGTIVFAASRMNPAPALSGDVVIATITFEVVGDDVEDAYGLTHVLLIDKLSRIVPSHWQGLDIYPSDPPVVRGTVYLPTASIGKPQ